MKIDWPAPAAIGDAGRGFGFGSRRPWPPWPRWRLSWRRRRGCNPRAWLPKSFVAAPAVGFFLPLGASKWHVEAGRIRSRSRPEDGFCFFRCEIRLSGQRLLSQSSSGTSIALHAAASSSSHANLQVQTSKTLPAMHTFKQARHQPSSIS